MNMLCMDVQVQQTFHSFTPFKDKAKNTQTKNIAKNTTTVEN